MLNTVPGIVFTGFIGLGAQNASAQTLELYGLAHMSADRLDTGELWVSNVASNSSRLGVRGRWVFSDDLALVYQYETGVDLTFMGNNSDGNGGSNDGNALFSKTRPSFLGVDTTLGKLLVGHIDWLDQWTNEFNMFADQVGDLGNFWAASGFPGRLDDVVQYRTPDALPGYATVAYRPSGDERGDALLLKAGYTLAHWTVSFTHTDLEPGEDPLANTRPTENHRAQILSIYRRTERYAYGGGMQRETDAEGRVGHDRISYHVSGSASLSQTSRLRAQVARTAGSGPESDALLWALGYDYLFSDQLRLYLDVAGVDNQANTAFSVNSKGHGEGVTPLPGHDQLVVSLGLVATFDTPLFGD